MKKRLYALLANGILLFGSVAATLVSVEWLLRLVNFNPPEYVTLQKYGKAGLLYRPNSTVVWYGNLGQILEFENTVSTNSLRLHDTEHSFQKPPGVYRILVLGDSFVEAHEVPLEGTFFKRLERDLDGVRLGPLKEKKAELISIGNAGQGILKELLELKYVGLKFNPDLVIAFVCMLNDIKDDWYHRQAMLHPATVQKPQLAYPDREIVRDLEFYEKLIVFKKSLLNRWLAFKIAGEARRRRERQPQGSGKLIEDYFIYADEKAPLDPAERLKWEEALQFSAGNLIRERDLCALAGAQFMVVFVDMTYLYDSRKIQNFGKNPDPLVRHLDFERPTRFIKHTLGKADIPYLDLTPVFAERSRSDETRFHFKYDSHWNKEGHRLVAETLGAYLKEQWAEPNS